MGEAEDLTRGSVQGRCPWGIPAYNNESTSKYGITFNKVLGLETGMKWQCVEFARRWLLLKRSILLPSVPMACHLIYVTEATDVETGKPSRVQYAPNGSQVPLHTGSLIIYACRWASMWGHVGVITEVGPNYVRVADQNRYFHAWGDKPYSSQFELRHGEQGSLTVVDKEEVCLGWLNFPDAPMRTSPPKILPGFSAPELPPQKVKEYVWNGIKRLPFLHRVAYIAKLMVLISFYTVRDKFFS